MFKTKEDAENAAKEVLKNLSNQWDFELLEFDKLINLQTQHKIKQYRYIFTNKELNLTLEETSNVYFVMSGDQEFDRSIFDGMKGEKTPELAIESFRGRLIKHAQKTLDLIGKI